MNGLPIPKEGWTYCPKCDANNMLASEGGKRYDCPICGQALMTTEVMGKQVALVAKPPLEMEPLLRYQYYIQKLITEQFEVEIKGKMPRRVKVCAKVFTAIGWFFSCDCKIITDKKYKEVTK